jgi:hypothetical protein
MEGRANLVALVHVPLAAVHARLCRHRLIRAGKREQPLQARRVPRCPVGRACLVSQRGTRPFLCGERQCPLRDEDEAVAHDRVEDEEEQRKHDREFDPRGTALRAPICLALLGIFRCARHERTSGPRAVSRYHPFDAQHQLAYGGHSQERGVRRSTLADAGQHSKHRS